MDIKCYECVSIYEVIFCLYVNFLCGVVEEVVVKCSVLCVEVYFCGEVFCDDLFVCNGVVYFCGLEFFDGVCFGFC